MMTATSIGPHRLRRSKAIRIPAASILSHLLCIIVGFYGGVWTHFEDEKRIEKEVNDRVRQLQQTQGARATRNSGSAYPKEMEDFLVGMAAVDRDSLTNTLDPGVPWDPSSNTNRQALVLYQSTQTLPATHADLVSSSTTAIPALPIETALADCHSVHLILTQPSSKQQCLVLTHQYEAMHIQKFMRLPPKPGQPLDPQLPLRLVNRAATEKGRISNKLPSVQHTKSYWQDYLQPYLQHFESRVLSHLQPLAQKVVHPSTHTIIVMVCNWGMVELVLNWFCGCTHRNIITAQQHTLIWATDSKTRDALTAAGLTVVYYDDDSNNMPEQAAGRYADRVFGKMMLAKVWCVQQLVWLGYNVLFQDADVIWYKDPLEYWVAAEQGEYDLYFQDE